MKRSRSGCRACRARKIKCDECRPACKTCVKRGINCSYEVKFQWIVQDEFETLQSTKRSRVVSKTRPKLTFKPRRGPISQNRVIGQEALETGILGKSALEKINTIMEETPFVEDEEVITHMDCPGSVDQFKKFRIYKKDDHVGDPQLSVYNAPKKAILANQNHEKSIVEDSANFPPRTDIPIHLHSPLYRPFRLGQAASTTPSNPITNSCAYNAHKDDAVMPYLHGTTLASTSSFFPHHPQAPVDQQRALPPSHLYIELPTAYQRPQRFSISEPASLLVMTEQDFFDHFVNIIADELVPIPYAENPFLSLLPEMAETDKIIRELLVAYGASHKCMLLHGSDPDPLDDQLVHQLISRCVMSLDELRKSEGKSQHALLSATLLAMIEVDRGNAMGWRYFMNQALDIIRTRATFSAWELGMEINSMTFRLIGYMSGIGNMSNSITQELLRFPSWPQWSGSLDYLTGVDLNLLPLFSEAANLIRETQQLDPEDFRERARINMAALKINQRMNDYWLDEYWPDSEITAMCIMFQEALQIHVLRRILLFPMTHPVVQRVVHLAIAHLDKWIPPASTMQRCMTFILATLASESLVAEHRTTLLIRLKHMGLAGFAYNWKVCDDIRKHWDANTSLIVAPETTLIV